MCKNSSQLNNLPLILPKNNLRNWKINKRKPKKHLKNKLRKLWRIFFFRCQMKQKSSNLLTFSVMLHFLSPWIFRVDLQFYSWHLRSCMIRSNKLHSLVSATNFRNRKNLQVYNQLYRKLPYWETYVKQSVFSSRHRPIFYQTISNKL